jgi:4-amino-4-deoxy-L-arabinose transferase-like glycosyltransferase
MFRKLFKYKLFLFILLLAASVRLTNLGSLGAGFFRDEAALGYNSWSISQTLKDEFGQFLPVIFRSFEVFFLPSYVYLSAIVMKLLGLSVFSTRLVSALSGVGIVIVTYLLVKLTFPKKKFLPELTSFLVSISPWTLFYSRGAFEGNLGLFFFTTSVYLFIRWYKIPRKYSNIRWSLVFMVLSMYSYQAERLVVPLWLLAGLYLTKKVWWDNRSDFLKISWPAMLLFIPLAFIWFSPAGLHRALGVSLAQAGSIPLLDPSKPAGIFINNKIYLSFKKILAMYVSYFSPRNLFWEVDYNPQRILVGQPVMFFWLLPGYLYSWWLIFKSNVKKNIPTYLLIIWALLGPLPAALTSDPFHTYRSLLLSVPLIILVSWGTYELLNRFTFKIKILSLISLSALLLFSLSRMLSSYLVVTPHQKANDWDQVFQSTVKTVEEVRPSKSKVVFDVSYSEPYIHYLFWTSYPPIKLHEVSSKLDLDYYSSIEKIRFDSLDNVYFQLVDWPTRRGDSGTVFVVPNDKVPPSEYAGDPKVELLKEIKNNSGQVVFRLLEVK